MKSLVNLAVATLDEMGSWCAVSTDKDCKTILARVEHEGESFLTISLPTFGKAFERCLELGTLDPSLFHPYWRVRGGHPVFLQEFLGLVFNPLNGILLDAPNVTAIRCIRQLTLMFAKIRYESSHERTRAAFAKYIETDNTVGSLDGCRGSDSRMDFVHMARRLWGNLLSRVDKRLYDSDYRPKHGPGSTADRLIGNQKYSNRLWSARLQKVFPYWENLFASWSQLCDQEEVTVLAPGAEIPVRVISVPKTPKTPRLIAMEPAYMQYMQQAILELFKEEIRNDSFASNFVCFDSQLPNQQLAAKGSKGLGLATLDLSDASDRVSVQHVADLLSDHRLTREAVFATRSTKADVLGNVITLSKFASMGSALCFPMESIVFVTIIFLAIQRTLGYRLSSKDIKSFFGRVRAFGDDLIIPEEFALPVIEELEAFGLKVNHAKSFWTGRFRESCGSDWYDGHPVDIVRVREPFPRSRKDAAQVVSLSSLRNQLAKAGFSVVVSSLDSLLEKILGGRYPWVGEDSALVGRIDYNGNFVTIDRMSPTLQRPESRGFVVDAPLPVNSVDGYDALQKFWLKRSYDPLSSDHLSHSGRPSTVRLKARWAASF